MFSIFNCQSSKNKAKSYGCSHSLLCRSTMGVQITVVLREGKKKRISMYWEFLKCSHPVRENASNKISHKGSIGKCVMHKRSDGKRDWPLNWVPPSICVRMLQRNPGRLGYRERLRWKALQSQGGDPDGEKWGELQKPHRIWSVAITSLQSEGTAFHIRGPQFLISPHLA